MLSFMSGTVIYTIFALRQLARSFPFVPEFGFDTAPAELAPNPLILAAHEVFADVLLEELPEDPPDDPPEEPPELDEPPEEPPPADGVELEEADFADVPLVLALPAFFLLSPDFRQ